MIQTDIKADVQTDVHIAVDKVENSSVFSAFNADNPSHYLVHAFAATKDLNAIPTLELGYYSKDHDKITVFKTEPIAIMPAEDVFKEKGVLQRLDVEALRFGLSDALLVADCTHKESYSKHPVLQAFCALQYNDVYDRPVWNITLVLGTLHMLNLKIDAINGEILVKDLQNIMSLRAN